MRTFKIIRIEDQTGTSGTGHVANGEVSEDGTTKVSWIAKARICDGSLREIKTTTIYVSPEDCALLHGHNGKTYLQFDDGTVMIDIALVQKAA